MSTLWTPPHCNLHTYMLFTISSQILLAARLNNRVRGHTVFFARTSLGLMLSTPTPRLALSSLDGVRLYHLYTDYSALPLRSQVCVDGREVSSMPEGRGRRRREGKASAGVGVKIHYIYTDCFPGWLAIRNWSHFLSTSSSSTSQHSTCSISRHKMITKPNKRRRLLTTGRNTRLKMTKHIHARYSPSPPCRIPPIFPLPFLLPVTFTPTTCPFQKNTVTWSEQKSTN